MALRYCPIPLTTHRVVLLIAACAVLGDPSLARSDTPAQRPAVDWLAWVPEDVRFYVEFRDLNRLRNEYRKLSIWLALSELGSGTVTGASRPASQPRMETWLGMTREEAVTRLLGRRTALLADSPSNWREGIVLAELSDAGDVAIWLKRWGAERVQESNGVVVYELRAAGSMRLAIRGAVLVFAPATCPPARWQQVQALLMGKDTARSLAHAAPIRAVLSRLVSDGDGLLVLNDPSRGGARLAAVMHSSARQLRVQAEWVEPVTATDHAADVPLRMPDLPRDALATWCGWFDGARWMRGARVAGGESVWDAALQLLRLVYGQTLLSERTLARLGPRVAVLIQRDTAARDSRYIAPVMSIVLESRDAEQSAADLAELMKLAVGVVNTQLARSGAGVTPLEIEEITLEHGVLRRIPIGRALSTYTSCPYLSEVDLAWVGDHDRVLISTSAESLRSMRRQAAGTASAEPTDKRPPTAATSPQDRQPAQWFHARGTEISNMTHSWLRFAGQQSPNAVRSSWWRQQALRRARESQWFGVTLKGELHDSLGGGAARVVEVAPDSPASGTLLPDDLIVAAEGDGLPVERPAREVAERFRQRVNGGEFTLDVVRNGQMVPLRIDMPAYANEPEVGFSPVRAMFPLIVISRPMSEITVTFHDDPPQRRRAEIVIDWRPLPTSKADN